jgi:DNA-binding ferritin-like protein
MLAELPRDNLKLEYLREAKEVVDTAGDNATARMLDDSTDQAAERAWFLFAAGQEG